MLTEVLRKLIKETNTESIYWKTKQLLYKKYKSHSFNDAFKVIESM